VCPATLQGREREEASRDEADSGTTVTILAGSVVNDDMAVWGNLIRVDGEVNGDIADPVARSATAYPYRQDVPGASLPLYLRLLVDYRAIAESRRRHWSAQKRHIRPSTGVRKDGRK